MVRLLLAFTALFIWAPASAEPMSPADFAASAVWSNPVLSPDGKRIALVMHEGDDKRIVILDADDPETVVQQGMIGKQPLRRIRWAGTDRLLLNLQTVKQFWGRYVLADRLWIYDLPTGESYEAAPEFDGTFAGDVLHVDPSGKWAIVAGQSDQNDYPSIRRVDLDTGKSKRIQNGRRGVWDWHADSRGVVRAGIQPSRTHDFAILYRDSADDDFERITIDLERNDEDEAIVDGIFLTLTDAPSLAISNHRTGRFGLYEFDIRGGRMGKAIFEHPTHDIDDFIRDQVSGDVLGIAYDDGRGRTHWLDTKMKNIQQRIDKALPGHTNTIVSYSTDRQRSLIHSSRGADPGLYYLLDLDKGRLDIVVNPYERVDPTQLSPVEPVQYTARDGVEIEGYLTLPAGQAASDLPLIVMPHGGPFARDRWSYHPWVQYLASLGYAVLQPNFRGSTGRGRDFVEKGYGEFGSGMLEDMYDGIEWLAGKGMIDQSRVCFMGASYGGYAAMWAAVSEPSKVRCAISFAGISDMQSMRKYDRKLFAATRYTEMWRDQVAGDVEALRDLSRISPIRFASRLKTPLFIAHGEKDKRVPVEQSKRMVRSLHNAGVPFEYKFYEKSGHGFDEDSEHEDFLRRLAAFLAKHNPA